MSQRERTIRRCLNRPNRKRPYMTRQEAMERQDRVVQMYQSGLPHAEIAVLAGVSKTHVYRILCDRGVRGSPRTSDPDKPARPAKRRLNIDALYQGRRYEDVRFMSTVRQRTPAVEMAEAAE